MAKRKGPLLQKRKSEIITELKEIVDSGQILGLTDTALSKRYDVDRRTIASYLDEIYSCIEPEAINHLRVKIEVMFSRIFRDAQRLVNQAKTDKDKKEAMEFLLKCIREFTDFLERFGLKPKAIENIAVKGEIDHKLQYEVIVKGQDEESES